MRYFCGKRTLPDISETLLRSGQLYFMYGSLLIHTFDRHSIVTAVNIDIVTTVLLLALVLGCAAMVFRGAAIAPRAVVVNAMACKVY